MFQRTLLIGILGATAVASSALAGGTTMAGPYLGPDAALFQSSTAGEKDVGGMPATERSTIERVSSARPADANLTIPYLGPDALLFSAERMEARPTTAIGGEAQPR